MSDGDVLAPYTLPAEDSDVHALREKLLKLEQFEHLVDGQAQIAIMFRWFDEIEAGRHVLGRCHLPDVQGKLKPLFHFLVDSMLGFEPDFLIILDGYYWVSVDTIDREILLFHELCHAIHKVDKYGAPRFTWDGRPAWGVAGHDVEEFTAVVERYGAHSEEIKGFIRAAAAGGDREHTD